MPRSKRDVQKAARKTELAGMSPFEAFCLKHVKLTVDQDEPTPLRLMDWQREFCIPYLHDKKPDGSHRYNHGFMYLPRGAAKTTTAAAMMLYHLVSQKGQPRIYSAANFRDQAKEAVECVENMVRADPYLSSKVRIKANSIEYNGGFIKAVSKEARSTLGKNPSFLYFDEIAFFRDRDAYAAMVSAATKRKHCFVLLTTTAGQDETCFGKELWQQYYDIHRGVVKAPDVRTTFHYADAEDDPWSVATWRKANPSLGHTTLLKNLKTAANLAKATPSATNSFKTFQLNIWTSSSTAFINMDDWIKGNRPLPDLTGRKCFGGLDLSSTTDLSCFLLLFPPLPEETEWYVLPKFYMAEERVKALEQLDKQSYQIWSQAGHLTLTPGNVIDFAFIETDIKDAAEKYQLLDIGYDRYLASGIIANLTGENILATKVGQGYLGISSAMKELQRKILSGTLVHAGHPVLKYNAASVVVSTDPSGNIKPDKGKSLTRIDGISALATALERAMDTPEEAKPITKVGDFFRTV